MIDLETHNELSDSEDDYSDSDTCDINEINNVFINSDHISESEIAKNEYGEPEYVLHISGTRDSTPNIAISLSNNNCEVYNLNNSHLQRTAIYSEHTSTIVDCKFDTINNNLLYTGSNDGTIKLWDMRDPKKSVLTFADSTAENEDDIKPFSCFDISSNGRLLSAGTDLHQGDAFILFWDTRNTNLLGAYWESHTDDVTQVKFHPVEMNTLLSGSTDGLINMYDLTQKTEDDALTVCFNTESSIEQLSWFIEKDVDAISCITHTADVQLWRINGVEPYKHFHRADVAREIKRKSENYTYVVKTHSTKNSLLLLAGSNVRNGECLRGLQIINGNVVTGLGFTENKQRVRCSWFNDNTNILITGGEKGILDAWKINPTIS